MIGLYKGLVTTKLRTTSSEINKQSPKKITFNHKIYCYLKPDKVT